MTGHIAKVLVLVTMFAAACSRGAPAVISSPSSSPKAGTIAWTDCGGGFQCGKLAVPLDYSHSSAGTIDIYLNRMPATDKAHRIGSLLINPGGPGASGITYLQESIKTFANLNRRFDLIGFDPRGVGQSSGVVCEDAAGEETFAELDGVLDDPQEKQDAINADKAYAMACQEHSGRVLPFVDTASAARDMDQIRAAVGDPKLTYLGFSYGTFLGQMYAHLFPKNIRALALDGVVDPALSANDDLLVYVKGFESNLQAFLTDCRAHATQVPRCFFAQGGDPGTKLMNLMQRLDATPLRVGGRNLTRSMAVTGVQAALFDAASWPYLDQALTLADRGDGSVLLQFAEALLQADPVPQNLAVTCLDKPVPTEISAYDALTSSFQQASPFFGPNFQYANLVCSYWPAKPTGKAEPLTADGAPPILLVGGTNDPATPYVEAQNVNKRLAGSVLLTRTGNGHTSYASSACSAQAEDAYLVDLTLPAAGTICSS
ncbi:MAG TPA: alpha/beta hydrolase [Candidatus Dormibacteraeota bacterium]|nr:alpha/beta hydrolase [Candidatus Dormibacteraeota bacterium]